MACQFKPGEITVTKELALKADEVERNSNDYINPNFESPEYHVHIAEHLIREILAKFARTCAIKPRINRYGNIVSTFEWSDVLEAINDGTILVEDQSVLNPSVTEPFRGLQTYEITNPPNDGN